MVKIKMKVLDHERLASLNESSVRSGRKQNLQPDQMPSDPNGNYVVNFRFDHDWKGQKDIRLSVVLKPGVLTAWLDVSPEEYAAIPEVEMSELEWEAAVCVGTPRWTD